MSESRGSIAGLPTIHTTFLGRERELEEIAALLTDPAVRLLTLIGVGGVGKTRLAIEVARRLAPEFDGRIIFVSLAASGSDQSVLDLVARAIGVPGALGKTFEAYNDDEVAAPLEAQFAGLRADAPA